MFRYLILALMLVSSVSYAHKVDGWWHTSGMRANEDDKFSHSHPLSQNYPPSQNDPRQRGTPQPLTSVTPTSDDTTAQDDSGATVATVNAPPLESLPARAFTATQSFRVTEYMLRDWSRGSGGGLPQWIELYNPNTKPVSLDGYQFTHAYKRFANHPWVYVTASMTGLTIPASDVALIANKSAGTGAWQISGISKEDVWIIPYDEERAELKNGWHLTDPNGKVVHRIGAVFRKYPASAPSDWDSSLGVPELPSHTSDGYRVSYQSLPSGDPDEDRFYGSQNDVGSPGFYEAAAPAAPSLQRPKLTTTWGHLKRAK